MIKKILFPVSIIIFQFACLHAQSPTADFTFSPTSGCKPVTVDFQDASTEGSSSIVSYQWVFDDGDSSSAQNPTHIYDTPGEYYPFLEIFDQNGYYSKKLADEPIIVSDFPNVSITNPLNPKTFCDIPADVNFSVTATSPSGNTITDYLWVFGDGDSSTLQNPVHRYNDFGHYDVELTVTDDAGCSTTISKPDFIKIDELKARISGPDTVCINEEFTMSNVSTGATGCVWYSSIHGSTPGCSDITLSDSVGGMYQLRLTVFASCGLDDTTINYYVEEPRANFSMDTSRTCSYPITVNFSDQSISTTKEWEWDFGDGGTSSEKNPTHTYTGEPGTGTSFPVELSITTYTGCTADTIIDFQDMHPDIIMDIDTSGCIPLPVTISDLTDWENDTSYFTTPEERIFKIYYPESLTNIYYQEQHSPDPDNVQKLFDTPGEYPAKLVIWDDICGWDSTTPQTIMVGDTLSIMIDTTLFGTPLLPASANLCIVPNNSYTFFITNNDTVRADEAEWFFPYLDTLIDSDIETDTSGTLAHQFYSPENSEEIITKSPGKDGIFSPYYKKISALADSLAGKTIDISVTVQHNECYYDTATVPVTFHGPIANIEEVSFECNDPYTYKFEGKFDQNELYQAQWEYYDINPPDLYDTTLPSDVNGEFSTSYYYKEADTASSALYVEKVILRGYSHVSGCEHEVDFERYIGLTSSKEIVDYHVHDSAKTFFGYNKKRICWDEPLVLNADTNENIELYNWTVTNTNTGNTIYSSSVSAPGGSQVTRKFDQRGVLNVQLNVVKKNYCEEYASNIIYAYKPYVNFLADDTAGCVTNHQVIFDTLDAFVTPDTNYVQWKWIMDTEGLVDDTVTNNTPASVNYEYITDSAVFFRPRLEITDELGCVAGLGKNRYILVTIPMPDFLSDTNVCNKELFAFKNISDSLGSSLTFEWDFGDGNTSTAYNPAYFYNDTGDYTVKLYAWDTIGCVDSIVKEDYIHIKRYH